MCIYILFFSIMATTEWLCKPSNYIYCIWYHDTMVSWYHGIKKPCTVSWCKILVDRLFLLVLTIYLLVNTTISKPIKKASHLIGGNL